MPISIICLRASSTVSSWGVGEFVGENAAYTTEASSGRGIAEDNSLLDRSMDCGCCASANEPELPGETTGGFEAIKGDRREEGGTVLVKQRCHTANNGASKFAAGAAFKQRSRPWTAFRGEKSCQPSVTVNDHRSLHRPMSVLFNLRQGRKANSAARIPMTRSTPG